MGTTTMMRIQNPPVDLSTLDNIKHFKMIYHEREDALFIRPDKARPATSVDWNGEIWIRVDPNNGEIVGFEIDDFEAVFLKKHPELAKGWESVKPRCRPRSKRSKETSWESYIMVILRFLKDSFKNNPQQLTFGILSS